MNSKTSWIKASVVVGGALTVAACSTYPREPRYPVRPTDVVSQHGMPTGPITSAPPANTVQNPYYTGQAATPPAAQAPIVEQGVRAPAGQVEGGSLPPPVAQSPYAQQPTVQPGAPAQPAVSQPVQAPVPSTGSIMPGATYEIQPGDTVSGIGRRFQTPVQTLIDLNNLGPRAAISTGQKILLPDTAAGLHRRWTCELRSVTPPLHRGPCHGPPPYQAAESSGRC
jgi:LysM repeat protein